MNLFKNIKAKNQDMVARSEIFYDNEYWLSRNEVSPKDMQYTESLCKILDIDLDRFLTCDKYNYPILEIIEENPPQYSNPQQFKMILSLYPNVGEIY